MLKSKKRTTCIVCRAKLLEDLVFIGDQFPSAVYPKMGADYRRFMFASSLNLTKCSRRTCGLVQLRYAYDLDFVYKNYPYLSGSTATMKKILGDVVDDVASRVALGANDVVLDIGGNDGTLLSLLGKKVRARINIDAAHGIGSVIKDSDYRRIEGKFTAQTYKDLKLPAPKVIFSVAMFYQLDDPLTFAQHIAKVMSEETLLCIQMTYLGSMLGSNIYDNIVHEHVAYYSLQSLEFLLNKAGLKVVDASVVASYGGSLRVMVKKAKGKPTMCSSAGAKLIRHAESAQDINTVEGLKRFDERVHLLKDFTRQIIDHVVSRHGKIFALGASTKGNMICQFLGLTREQIAFALDNNEKKIGLVMAGSDIPVADEREYLGRLTEYLFILPYYYTEFFQTMVQKHLKPGQTVYLIVPLPTPHLIKLSGIGIPKGESDHAKTLHQSSH